VVCSLQLLRNFRFTKKYRKWSSIAFRDS
jgi:hypothetical protein